MARAKKVVGVYERPDGSKRGMAIAIAVAIVVVALLVYVLAQ